MELLIGIVVLIISVFFIRVFSVLVHELGHAIPALIFTKEPVIVYIGSYGSRENSFKIELNKLTIFIYKNPLYLLIGLCSHKYNNLSILKNIIVIVMGPFSSFIIAAISAYFVFAYELHGMLKTLSFIFLISSIIDLYYNLRPSSTPIKLSHGGVSYNDGYQLMQNVKLLFKSKDYQKKYAHLSSLSSNDGDIPFLEYYEKYTAEGFKNMDMLEIAISAAINQNRLEIAIVYLKELEEQKQLTADDYLQFTYVEFSLGNDDAARAYCEKALKHSPNNVRALIIQIEWYIEDGEREKTNELIQKIEPIKNKGISEFFILGRIYLSYGEIEKAIAALEEAKKLYPSDNAILVYLGASYAKNGNKQKAQTVYKELVNTDDDSIDHLITRSYLLFELHNCKDGIALLLKALKIEHNNPFALNNMSHGLNLIGRYEDAIDYANKGISISPKKHRFYTNKAFAQLMLGQLEEGIATNDIALSLNPNNSYAYRNSGIYYKENGDFTKAEEHLQKAIDLDKTTFMAANLLNEIRVKQRKNN